MARRAPEALREEALHEGVLRDEMLRDEALGDEALESGRGAAHELVASLLARSAERLERAGVAHARFEVRALMAHVLGVDAQAIERAVIFRETWGAFASQELWKQYAALLARRERREPLQYLVGSAPFRKLTLQVGEGVFIPRFETEMMLDEALRWVAERHARQEHLARQKPVADAPTSPDTSTSMPAPWRIVDLCAGSGAIGLAAASEIPHAQVLAVERSTQALTWLNCNAAALREQWAREGKALAYASVEADATNMASMREAVAHAEYSKDAQAASSQSSAAAMLRAALPVAALPIVSSSSSSTLAPSLWQSLPAWLQGVDMVLTNPPYIPQSQPPTQPEVRYDPAMALYGGSADGLRIPEAIVKVASQLLRSGGLLLMEHDASQGAPLVAQALHCGFREARTLQDFNGRDRLLYAIR